MGSGQSSDKFYKVCKIGKPSPQGMFKVLNFSDFAGLSPEVTNPPVDKAALCP
jgi:hypothetical protein